MAFSQIAYKALQDVVGVENVSDDEVVCIIKLDAKNMYAVVEPYVSFAELQTEAMKNGLTCPSPLAGAQISVLANYSWHGAYGNSWISGVGAHNLLAYEIILPDGEMMRSGPPSLAEGEWFWNDGPGPDLRGLLRGGQFGHAGGLGMVTKISCRLTHWAGPTVLPTHGVSIEKVSPLPHDKFRWYMVRFPFKYPEEEEKELKQSAELFYEMGKAEIAVVATHLAKQFLYTYSSKTKQDLFDNMKNNVFPSGFCVIGLQATTSLEQLNYEEKVLKGIVAKVGGEFVDEGEEPYKVWIGRVANEWLRFGHGIRLARPSDGFSIGASNVDSIDSIVTEILRSNRSAKQMLAGEKQLGKDFVQPLSVHGGWISPQEFGHWCLMTTDVFPEQSVEQANEAIQIIVGHLKGEIEDKSPAAVVHLLGPSYDFLGPIFGNVHLIMKKIKNVFDPNNLSNPPYATRPDVLSEEEVSKMMKGD